MDSASNLKSNPHNIFFINKFITQIPNPSSNKWTQLKNLNLTSFKPISISPDNIKISYPSLLTHKSIPLSPIYNTIWHYSSRNHHLLSNWNHSKINLLINSNCSTPNMLPQKKYKSSSKFTIYNIHLINNRLLHNTKDLKK